MCRILPAVSPFTLDPPMSDDGSSQRRPPQRDRLPPTQNCLPFSIGTSRVCPRIHAVFLGCTGSLVHRRKGQGRHVRGGHHHPTPSLWRVAAVTCHLRQLPQQLGQLRLFPRPQSRNKGLAHLTKLSVILCHFLTFLSFFVILCHIDCVSCHFCNLLIAGLWFAAGLSSPLHGARDARPGCGAVQVWKVPPPDARLETSDHSQAAKRARHLAQTLQHYGQQNRARNQVSFAVELGAIRLHQERRTQVWPLRHFGALRVHGQFRTLLQLLQNAAGQLVQVYIQ